MPGNFSDIRIPSCPESEKALCCIALNYPREFVEQSSEHRFQIDDLHDPVVKAVVRCVYAMECSSKTVDIRLVYEQVKKDLPVVEFYQLSELWTLASPCSTLVEHMNLIRMTAKRRSLIRVLNDTHFQLEDSKSETANILADLNSKVDKLATEAVSTKAPKLKDIIFDALNRYQNGEDKSQRISTGFESLDELTPISRGDWVVIGGMEKSGKTTLALNIIANILRNEARKSHATRN